MNKPVSRVCKVFVAVRSFQENHLLLQQRWTWRDPEGHIRRRSSQENLPRKFPQGKSLSSDILTAGLGTYFIAPEIKGSLLWSMVIWRSHVSERALHVNVISTIRLGSSSFNRRFRIQTPVSGLSGILRNVFERNFRNVGNTVGNEAACVSGASYSVTIALMAAVV